MADPMRTKPRWPPHSSSTTIKWPPNNVQTTVMKPVTTTQRMLKVKKATTVLSSIELFEQQKITFVYKSDNCLK